MDEDQRDKEKPFMLMYGTKAPHRNWQPGPKYITKYDNVTLPEPDTLFDDYKDTLAAYQQDMTIAETMNREISNSMLRVILLRNRKNFGTLPITQKMKPYKKRT